MKNKSVETTAKVAEYTAEDGWADQTKRQDIKTAYGAVDVAEKAKVSFAEGNEQNNVEKAKELYKELQERSKQELTALIDGAPDFSKNATIHWDSYRTEINTFHKAFREINSKAYEVQVSLEGDQRTKADALEALYQDLRKFDTKACSAEGLPSGDSQRNNLRNNIDSLLGENGVVAQIKAAEKGLQNYKETVGEEASSTEESINLAKENATKVALEGTEHLLLFAPEEADFVQQKLDVDKAQKFVTEALSYRRFKIK